MKSIVSPSYLKQRAKQLKKVYSLKLHQALDAAAVEHGFSNYKHYLNFLAAKKNKKELEKRVLLKKIILEPDILKKAVLAISCIENFSLSFEDLFDTLKQFEKLKFKPSVCEKMNLEEDTRAFLLNDFQSADGKTEIQDVHELFIAKDISIKNLNYEFCQESIFIDGDYELTVECEDEGTDENENDSFFNDRIITGHFGVSIDKNKKIDLDYCDSNMNFGDGFTKEEIAEYYKRFPEEKLNGPPPIHHDELPDYLRDPYSLFEDVQT